MSAHDPGGRKTPGAVRIAADNAKARRDYEVVDVLEAGIVLQGTEVKSLREGKANLTGAFAVIRDGECFLMNADISPCRGGNMFNHAPTRPRKLLLRRRELNRLDAAVRREGMTLVPLKLYFGVRGFAKLTLGAARGRKKADKRRIEKERDWARDKARLLRRGARSSDRASGGPHMRERLRSLGATRATTCEPTRRRGA